MKNFDPWPDFVFNHRSLFQLTALKDSRPQWEGLVFLSSSAQSTADPSD